MGLSLNRFVVVFGSPEERGNHIPPRQGGLQTRITGLGHSLEVSA